MVNRLAFTLIELIFAIVIIGISVISLPMMSQVIAKNTKGSMVQEAIYAASAELNQVVSYNWDENSIEDNASISRVVWASSNECNNNTKRRVGHINQPYHRRCTDDNTSGVTSVKDNLDDLDDAAHGSAEIFDGDISRSGYKTDYYSSVSVSSSSFGGASASNIKKVTINIFDEDEKIVQLSTFSANIGEVDYYKRTYP